MINVILQSLGLDLVNINVYANVYHNIANGLRVMDYPTEDTQLHKLTGDTDRGRRHRAIIGHTPKVNLQLLCRSTFSGPFKSYGHFSQNDQGHTTSQTDRGQTTSQTDRGRTHRAIIGRTPKVNLQLRCRSTFSGSRNYRNGRIGFPETTGPGNDC